MHADLWILITMNGVGILLAAYFAIFVYPGREWTDETKRRPRSFISNAFFREYWYYLIGPMKRQLIRWNVHPNTLTWTGFFLSICAGIAFAITEFGIGGWLVIMAATCDIYDGMLAREQKISLKSGAFLDSALDRIGEVAIFYGLARYFRGDDLWFAIVFIGFASSQVVSYSRARAEGLGFPGDRGFFQRAERMIILSIFMPFVPVLDYFWGAGHVLVSFVVGVISVGSMITAVSRTGGTYRLIRRTEMAKAPAPSQSSPEKRSSPTPEKTTLESMRLDS